MKITARCSGVAGNGAASPGSAMSIGLAGGATIPAAGRMSSPRRRFTMIPRSDSMSERNRARARSDADAAASAPAGTRDHGRPAPSPGAPVPRCRPAGLDARGDGPRLRPATTRPAVAIPPDGCRPRPGTVPLTEKPPGRQEPQNLDAPDEIPGGGQSDRDRTRTFRTGQRAVRARWIRHSGIECGEGGIRARRAVRQEIDPPRAFAGSERRSSPGDSPKKSEAADASPRIAPENHTVRSALPPGKARRPAAPGAASEVAGQRPVERSRGSGETSPAATA